MPDLTPAEANHRGGAQPLASFEAALRFPHGFASRTGGETNPHFIAAVQWMANGRPSRQNFWPALVLAMVSQAEETLSLLGLNDQADVFEHVQVETRPDGGVVNTLNFVVANEKITLRPRFNDVAQVIRVDMRRDHPSAAAHATQAWPAYRTLVVLIFAMSPAARTRFAELIWQSGVLEVAERRWATQAERIVRPFEKVLTDFDTRNATPGGALFQGLVYGYFTADSPNLTLESHQVNTGSSRVDMPGDVAGFRGGEVELAIEVKDYAITLDTVENVLSDFLEDLVEAPNATAVVVADEVDDEARVRLAASNVVALSRADLQQRVVTWDLPKQQDALRGAIYYLSRIQKRSTLVEKLVTFLHHNEIAAGILDQPTLHNEETSGDETPS